MDEHGPDLAQQRTQARERLEIMEALVVAVDRRREVLDLVADAESPDEALPRLVELLGCTEIGALALLDLQVRRFAAVERDRLRGARDDLVEFLDTIDSSGLPEPLVVGRGLVLADQFCEATGLTHAEVEPLLADGRVEGVRLETGEWHAAFDDVLPTREDLLGWGLTADPAYDPELLRGRDGLADDELAVLEDEDDGHDDTGDTWASRW